MEEGSVHTKTLRKWNAEGSDKGGVQEGPQGSRG